MLTGKDTRMVDDTFSCIKVITKNVKVTLFNVDYSNEITGISDVLESWKRQYIKALNGIVVSYKNVHVISRAAYLKLDCPVIHCIVKATFELFIPTVGRIIKGKVNRISHDYIGCLIHNTINAAIYRSRDDTCDVFIALDQVILFEITHLGFKRKIIRVKGKITQECINLMQELNLLYVETDAVRRSVPINTTSDPNESTASGENEKSNDTDMETENQSQSLLCNTAYLFVGNSGDISSNSPKKEKKKSNKSESTTSLFESLEIGKKLPGLLSCNNAKLFAENSTDVSSDSAKKKKKKSNKLQIDQSTNILMESLENADESISSLSYNVENSTDERRDSPKKKKKKSNKLQIEHSINGLLESVKNTDESVSVLPYNNAENSTDVSCDSPKKKKKRSDKLHIKQHTNRLLEDYDFMKILSCDPSLEKQLLHNEVLQNNKDKPSTSTKRAKKRKHESPDRDGLPKKKKKIEGNKSISVKTSKKHKAHKTDKKNKEKCRKDSKRDKKEKPKKKVISSKKKLPKLKKKNKEKREKLKEKKSKKSPKRKKKDVP